MALIFSTKDTATPDMTKGQPVPDGKSGSVPTEGWVDFFS